jgi:hypothetical protein
MMATVSPNYVCGMCFAEGVGCTLVALALVTAILLAVDWARGR